MEVQAEELFDQFKPTAVTCKYPSYPARMPIFNHPMGFEMVSTLIAANLLTRPDRLMCPHIATQLDFKNLFDRNKMTQRFDMNGIFIKLREKHEDIYSVSDFDQNAVTNVIENQHIKNLVFGEQDVTKISSVHEILIGIMEHWCDPKRLIFVLDKPTAFVPPECLNQYTFRAQSRDWAMFKDVPTVDRIRKLKQAGKRVGNVVKVWAIYRLNSGYIMELPFTDTHKKSATAWITNNVTTLKPPCSDLFTLRLIAVAYEPAELIEVQRKESSSGSLCFDASYSSSVPETSEAHRKFLRDLFAKVEAKDTKSLIIHGCCNFYLFAKLIISEEVSELSAILSMYPNLTFPKSYDVDKLRERYDRFVLFVAYLTEALREFNRNEFIQAAEILFTACVFLPCSTGAIVNFVKGLMKSCFKRSKKDDKVRTLYYIIFGTKTKYTNKEMRKLMIPRDFPVRTLYTHINDFREQYEEYEKYYKIEGTEGQFGEAFVAFAVQNLYQRVLM